LLVGSGDTACDALTTDFVRLRPVRELCRLNDHSSEKLAEGAEKVPLSLCLLDSVAIFGESRLEAVVDCLGQVVVKSVEELLLGLLRNARVLDERIGNVVGGHAVEQELVVRFVLVLVLLALELGADEVPEGVADQRVEVLHVDDR